MVELPSFHYSHFLSSRDRLGPASGNPKRMASHDQEPQAQNSPARGRSRRTRDLSLADLTSSNNFKFILRWRLNSVDGQTNTFNYNLGKALVQIAYEWVKVDAQGFAELKRLLGKVPVPLMGLTDKNKCFLRQFD